MTTTHRRFVLEAVEQVKELHSDYESRFQLAVAQYTELLSEHLRGRGVRCDPMNQDSGTIRFPSKHVKNIFCHDVLVQLHLISDDPTFVTIKEWMIGYNCTTFSQWFKEIKRLHDTRQDRPPAPDVFRRAQTFEIKTAQFFANETIFLLYTPRLYAYLCGTFALWRHFSDVPRRLRGAFLHLTTTTPAVLPCTDVCDEGL